MRRNRVSVRWGAGDKLWRREAVRPGAGQPDQEKNV